MVKLLKVYKKWPIQVRASFWFLMCSFLQKGISVITTPIFTRLLTTVEYGQFSVFNSWMQLVTPIISLNLYSGVYAQGVVKFDQDKNRFSSTLQGLSLTLILVWMLIYMTFHSYINNALSLTTVQILSMFLMIWVSGSFNFWSMNERVDFHYKKLVTLTLAVSIFQPIIGILFVTNSDDKVTARILGMVIVQLIFWLGTFIIQMKKGKVFYSLKYWRYALRFNIPLLPHYLSLTVLSSSDRIMIGQMVGNDKAGIYNLAYSVSLIMTMFNTALLQTIEPWIYKKLKAKKVSDIARVAYPSFIFVAAANILLIMFAPEVISVFAPTKYQEAIWIVPSVALSVYFMFLYSFFATFEFYFEKTYYVAIATLTGAIFNIVMNVLLIRKFGYMAAGYTTLFSYVMFAILHYMFMTKICKQYLDNIHPYSLKIIVNISLVTIILSTLSLLTYRSTIIRYILILLLFIIAIIIRRRILNTIKLFVSIRNQKNEDA